MGAVEDYLEGSTDIQVDIEALERLIEPEDEKVCLRYILKYSTRRGSNMFKLFNTKREEGPSRGKQKALGGTPNFNFPTRVLRVVCGYSLKDVWRSRSRPSQLFFLGRSGAPGFFGECIKMP